MPLVIARLFSLLLLAAVSAQAADLTIVRVYTSWRDAASFKRISEYFNGQENTGGEEVVRSQPGMRGGYYFLVRVENPGAARTIKATVRVINAAKVEPRNFQFPVHLKAGKNVFHLGLTGDDWPDAKAHPVAWRLELTEDDGPVLATRSSYLWEKSGTP